MIPAAATAATMISAAMQGATVLTPAVATVTMTATTIAASPLTIPAATAAVTIVGLEAIRGARGYVDCDAQALECIRMCHQGRDEGTGGCILGCTVAKIVCKILTK